MVTNKIEGAKKLLPLVVGEVEAFFVAAIVKPLEKIGVAKAVAEYAVKEALSMLKDPQKIGKFLGAAQAMSVDHLKAMLKDTVGGFLRTIVGEIKGTVGKILTQALDFASKGTF